MSFSGWIMSITGAICLSVFADILMADGSTKKYVKGITALIVFAVIVAPIPTFLNKDFSFNDILPTVGADEAFVEEVVGARYKIAETETEMALAEKGYDGANVTVYYDSGSGEIYCVTVFWAGSVINSDKDNINIKDDITTYVADAFGLDERSVIVVY